MSEYTRGMFTNIFQFIASFIENVMGALYSVGDWFYANPFLVMIIVLGASAFASIILALESRLTD